MRYSLIIVLALAAAACAADVPAATCASAANCGVSKHDLKEARRAFERAEKLQKSGATEDAFDSYQHAAALVPSNIEFATARELARQQLVHEHLQRGNLALENERRVQALTEFRDALKLDPQNDFALQRLRDALGEWQSPQKEPVRVLAQAGEIQVQPEPLHADFHFRGDSRDLLKQIATVYGFTPTIDDSVTSRRVAFEITDVDFFSAMRAAGPVTKTFWAPVSEKQIIVAADTPEFHRQLDRMVLRTIFIPGITAPQQLNEIVNLLRTLFDIRYISQQANSSTITVRAPQAAMDAASRLLDSLDATKPQVLLDVQLFSVSHTLTRDLGLNLPANFQMFNIPASALALLGGRNIQDLINQLIASGGINQAISGGLAGLLAQEQNQASSIFSQPFATFGGGKTLMGLSFPQISATMSVNESAVNSIDHVTLHAAQSDPAIFRAGERYPILNASFAPIFNSPSVSRVIQNGSFTTPFPSFNYEDLGLTLKAKPIIHGSSSVTLDMELQIRALAGQSLNGVPVIADREYKGTITVKNGEQAVVAGTVSNSEQRSVQGIPGFAQLPGLSKLTSANTKQYTDDELLVVITPHILSPLAGNETEVWMPASK